MRSTLSMIVLTTGIALLGAREASAQISLTVDDLSWLDAVWDSPAVAPTSGNQYQTAQVGTNRVRTSPALQTGGGNSDFPGDSLLVVSGTQLLVKQEGTQTASIKSGNGDLGLDGGSILFDPDTVGSSPTLDVNQFGIGPSGGTIEMAAYVGTYPYTTIDGTLTGPGDLSIGTSSATSTDDANITITDIAGYTGDITVYGAHGLDFNADYHFPGTLTVDFLGRFYVDQHYTFNQGGLILPQNDVVEPGYYDAQAFNLRVGDYGYAFPGGSVTVLPEPGSAVLLLIALAGLLPGRWRRQ